MSKPKQKKLSLNPVKKEQESNTWREYMNATPLPPKKKAPKTFETTEPFALRMTYANWKKNEKGFPEIWVRYEKESDPSKCSELELLDSFWLLHFQKDIDASKYLKALKNPDLIPFDEKDKHRRPLIDIRYIEEWESIQSNNLEEKKQSITNVPVREPTKKKTPEPVQKQEDKEAQRRKVAAVIKNEIDASDEIDEETKENDRKYVESFTMSSPDPLTASCFLKQHEIQTIINYDAENKITKGELPIDVKAEENEPGTINVSYKPPTVKEEPSPKKKPRAKNTEAAKKKSSPTPSLTPTPKSSPSIGSGKAKKESIDITKAFLVNNKIKITPDVQAISWLLSKAIQGKSTNKTLKKLKDEPTFDFMSKLYIESERIDRLCTITFMLFRPNHIDKEIPASEFTCFESGTKNSSHYFEDTDMFTYITPSHSGVFKIDWGIIYAIFYVLGNDQTGNVLHHLITSGEEAMEQFKTTSTNDWIEEDMQVAIDFVHSVFVPFKNS